MQGCRKVVATLTRKDVPSALPVHCLVHSLEFCLQGGRRKLLLLKDAIELVRGRGSEVDQLPSSEKFL